MDKSLNKMLKLSKLIIGSTIFISTIATFIFAYFHIVMYPVNIVFYPQEIILLIVMPILFLFTIRYKMKYIKIIAVINILLDIINLLGFKVVIYLVR